MSNKLHYPMLEEAPRFPRISNINIIIVENDPMSAMGAQVAAGALREAEPLCECTPLAHGCDSN